MAASIAPVSIATASAAVTSVTTPQLTLQPGTVVSAQVVQLLENGLAQIAIEGIAIAALSEVPLQVGDALKLAVSQATNGVIRLSIVPQGAGTSAGAPTATSGAAASVTGNAVSVGPTSAPPGTPSVSAPALSTPVSAEAVAIAVATQAAAPRQQSLSPLFANLPVVVASDAAPPEVQAGASQLLALRPELTEQLSASDLRTAFDQSGLFLEATLASGTAPAPSSDLKAALVTFRDAVSSWLATAAEGAPVAWAVPNTPQAQAVTVADVATLVSATEAAVVAAGISPASVPGVLAEAVPQEPAPQITVPGAPTVASSAQKLPSATNFVLAALEAAQQPLEGEAVRGTPQPAVLASLKSLQAIMSVAAITKSPTDASPQSSPLPPRAFAPGSTPAGAGPSASVPPPFRGAAPAAQAIAQASLAPEAAPKDIGRHLLEQTDAAIARQTLLQVASLPDRPDTAGTQFNSQITDTSSQRWHFEIPFAMPQGTALAQFEIERDGSGNQVEASSPKVWRARFTLNIEPTGPVHALVSLVGDKTAVRMWAERPETAAKIRAQSGDLVQALRAAELQPGDIVISGGAPPQGPAKAGHFLDRAS